MKKEIEKDLIGLGIMLVAAGMVIVLRYMLWCC